MALLDFNKVDLNKKVRLGLGFSLLILIVSSVISYYSISELVSQSQWVDHTNEVRIEVEKIISILKDAETGQRGYLLTGKREFLESFESTQGRLKEAIHTVQALTADNSVQQKNLESLMPLAFKRMARLDEVVGVFEKTGKASSSDMVEGKALMDQCRQIVNEMQKEELRLLDLRASAASKYYSAAPVIIALSSFFAILVSIFAFYFISKDIATKEQIQQEMVRLNEDLATYNEEIINSKNELDQRNYVLSGIAQLNDLLRGEKILKTFGDKLLEYLCDFLKSPAGVLYFLQDNGQYKLSNFHAFDVKNKDVVHSFGLSEGLLGQTALGKKTLLIEDVPANGLNIVSAFSTTTPFNILIVPFVIDDYSIAVIELISDRKLEGKDFEFIESIRHPIATYISSINSATKTEELLTETQNQAEELEAQQEELRQINDEMRNQRDQLQASEAQLKVNEEELQEKNTELEEKTNELEEQYEAIRAKNQELLHAKEAIQLKMDQVETISKYKSEFLANMSHELRTPLNSILILAKILKDNKNNTLTAKEAEHAGIIERSGNDLLKLINEVLDLARIESGKIKLELSDVSLKDFDMKDHFGDLAMEKNIQFNFKLEEDVPATVYSDRFRLEQVIKNLLSNAFKFTPKGKSIEFRIHTPKGISFQNPNLIGKKVVAFSVQDTGIGIPDDKKNVIFEAFQQADLSTTRKFGGSGLGLTISRDLATLLGGEIQFQSKLEEGSTFTLYVPVALEEKEAKIGQAVAPAQQIPIEQPQSVSPQPVIAREAPSASLKSTILIIEDDFYFCKILADYAERKGYEVFTANTGKEGHALAQAKRPDAILLDIQLPDANGWDILRKFKNDPTLKRIPVHLMSAYDKEGAQDLGQENFIPKPVTLEVLDNALGKIKFSGEKELKKVLIVEDNEVENQAVKDLLLTQEVNSDSAFTGTDALALLAKTHYDCVILDINLPDMNGYHVLEKVKTNEKLRDTPVIIYSGKDLTEKEEADYKKYANTIIIKTEYSYTRLMEEVKLFLYSMDQTLKKSESIFKNLQNAESILKSKKALIVDDDMRNVYSLTNVLEQQDMSIVVAYNGKQAIEELENNPDIDIVLMDIMMPEMDGIEATTIIRTKEQFKNLPIIAVTAKAMPGDKEKCVAAGVSDYISKPIDINKLVSLMRVWLYES